MSEKIKASQRDLRYQVIMQIPYASGFIEQNHPLTRRERNLIAEKDVHVCAKVEPSGSMFRFALYYYRKKKCAHQVLHSLPIFLTKEDAVAEGQRFLGMVRSVLPDDKEA